MMRTGRDSARRLGFVGVGAFLAVVGMTGGVVIAAATREEPSVAPSESAEPLPPEKQAIEDAYASLKAYGQTHQKTKVAINPNPAGETVPPPDFGTPAGIGLLVGHEDTSQPPGHMDDIITNSWTAFSPKTNIDVWAGAYGDNSKQGFLLVQVWNGDRTSIVIDGVYDTPTADGVVTIGSVDGQVLMLQAADGVSFDFDTAALAFR